MSASGENASTEQVVIRDAERSEHAALARVFRRASWWNEGDRAFLAANPHLLDLDVEVFDKGRLRVADVDGTVVGFATTIESGDALELDDLFVDPDWMRHGIGAQLVDDAVAHAREHAVACIEVTGDDHALGFYERVGFVVVGAAPTLAGSSPRLRLELAARGS